MSESSSSTSPLLAPLSASFLHSSQALQVLGGLMGLLSGSGAMLAALHHAVLPGVVFLLGVCGALPWAWYALRIRFDVACFQQIAQYTPPAHALSEFDAALIQLGFRHAADTRDLAQRARASKKLIYRLAAVVCGQWLCVLTGTGLLYV